MARRYKYSRIIMELYNREETQKELGIILGISSVAFRKKMLGEIQWKKREIDTLCKHFNLTYEELFKED